MFVTGRLHIATHTHTNCIANRTIINGEYLFQMSFGDIHELLPDSHTHKHTLGFYCKFFLVTIKTIKKLVFCIHSMGK